MVWVCLPELPKGPKHVLSSKTNVNKKLGYGYDLTNSGYTYRYDL